MPGTDNHITFTTNCVEAGSFEYIDATTNPEFHTKGAIVIEEDLDGGTGGGALEVAGGARIDKNLSVGEDIIAFHTSDQRQKDDIVPIDSALEKLHKIRGVTFTWNDKAPSWTESLRNKQDVGVIAQEIEMVLPEAVTTRKGGFKAVDYQRIVPLLLEAIKELSTRVEELESCQ
jgi:hypothetical protein